MGDLNTNWKSFHDMLKLQHTQIHDEHFALSRRRVWSSSWWTKVLWFCGRALIYRELLMLGR